MIIIGACIGIAQTLHEINRASDVLKAATINEGVYRGSNKDRPSVS
jgi:hypothetical protein